MDELGERLRWARERRLLTQEQLSQQSGVMEATISRIENGKHTRRPRTATLAALAEVLNVSIEWLVFGEDEVGKLAA